MLKRFPFTPFEPDKPLTVSGALNVWPRSQGFAPVKSLTDVTTPLSGIIGGSAFIASGGTTAVLGGTATNLYTYNGLVWTSTLGSLSASIWRFEQFTDLAIGVNGAAPVKYDMQTATAAVLGGSPPNADLAATVRNQLFLAGDPTERTTLAISGYNDAEEWTAGANQCLYVPFPSGGDIMGLAGGETGIILQRNSIKRATYTGDVTVWQFDEISRDIGCMAKGSVAQAGQMVFFLSEQGFKVTDRNTVVPIGFEKVDKTFFETYSRADITNISVAVDPQSTTVVWAMPGLPGKLWAYNWSLEQWATIEANLQSVMSGFTPRLSLDAIDALYPGGIDLLPYSLDSQLFAGGNPLFIVVGRDGALKTFAGDNMAAEMNISPIEVADGARARIRGARAVSDAVAGVVTLDARARAGDPIFSVVSGSIRDNGRVPLRANGRHVGMALNIPAGEEWTYALGLDLEFEPGGAR